MFSKPRIPHTFCAFALSKPLTTRLLSPSCLEIGERRLFRDCFFLTMASIVRVTPQTFDLHEGIMQFFTYLIDITLFASRPCLFIFINDNKFYM